MKIKFYLLLIALVTTIGSVWGQAVGDRFTVDGINYIVRTITPDFTVAVDRGNYTGDITISATITDAGGQDYNVTEIGNLAFEQCFELYSVILPEGITKISDGAFSNAFGLTSVNIPSTVKEIRHGAFQGCPELNINMVIPEGVTSIPTSLFRHSGITSFHIPASVTSIGNEAAFEGTSKLTAITVADESSHFKSIDGVLYTKDGTKIVWYPDSKTGSSLDMPNTVTSLFFGDRYSALTFGSKSLTEIKGGNPANFSSSNGVLYNGAGSTLIFCPMGKTGTYDVPANTVISIEAFRGGSLTTINLPGTVSFASSDVGRAFADNALLTAINVTSTSTTLSSDNGILFNSDKTTLLAYPSAKNDILDYDLTSMTTLETIGGYAFTGNFYVETVTAPSSLTTIGTYVFRDAKSIKTVKPIDNVAYIGPFAFSRSSLESITLPNNSGFTTIYEATFAECLNLTSIEIPSSVTKFEGNNQVSGCINLTDVILHEGLEIITPQAFSTTGISSITIPASVTNIGIRAFATCSNLKEVVFLGSTPPATIVADAFYNLAEDAIVIVPKGSETAYADWITEKNLQALPTADIYTKAEVNVVEDPSRPNPSKPTFVDENGKVVTVPPGADAEKEYTILPEDSEKYEVEKVIVTDSDGNKTELERGPDGEFQITIDDDMDIEVVIVAKKIVTFINDGVTTLQYVKNGALAVAPNVSKAGSTLNGWANGTSGSWNFSTPVTADLTLTASWTVDVMYTVTITPLTGVAVNKSTTSVKAGTTFSFTATSATGTVTAYLNNSLFAPSSDNFYSLVVSDNVSITFSLTAGSGSGSGTDGKVVVDGSESNIGGGFPSTGEIVLTPPAVTPGTTPEVTIDGETVTGEWKTDENGDPIYVIDYDGLPNGDHKLVVDGEEYEFTTGGGSGSGSGSGTSGGKVVVDGNTSDLPGKFPSGGEIILTPPAVTPGTTPSVTIDGKEVTGEWKTDENGNPIYVIEYDNLPNGDHKLVVDGKEYEFTTDSGSGSGSGSGSTGGTKVIVDGSDPVIPGEFPSTGGIVIYPPAVDPSNPGKITIDGKEVDYTIIADADGNPIAVEINYDGLSDGKHILVIDGEEFEFTTGSGSGATGGGKVIVDGSTPDIPGDFPPTGGIVVYPPAVDPNNPGTITIDGKEVDYTVITDADGNPIAVEINYDGLSDGNHTLVINGKEYTFTTNKNAGATSNDVLSVATVTASYGSVTIDTPKQSTVYVVSLRGSVVYNAKVTGTVTVNVPAGIYVVVVDGVSQKIVVR